MSREAMLPDATRVGTERSSSAPFGAYGVQFGGMDVQPNVLDQNCESRQALERIADKWTCLVVYALVDGPRRHGELRRAIDGISQKMLTQTLRSMEADGLVRRTVFDVVRRSPSTA